MYGPFDGVDRTGRVKRLDTGAAGLGKAGAGWEGGCGVVFVCVRGTDRSGLVC